jgi:hypothetical protein
MILGLTLKVAYHVSILLSVQQCSEHAAQSMQAFRLDWMAMLVQMALMMLTMLVPTTWTSLYVFPNNNSQDTVEARWITFERPLARLPLWL